MSGSTEVRGVFPGVRVIPALLAVMLVGAAVCFAPPAAANPGVADIDDPDEIPGLESVLARYVEAVGGRDAVMQLRDRVAAMRCVTDLQRDRHTHEVDTLTVYGTSSGEYLVVTRTDRGVIVEGFDGDRAWRVDTDGAVLECAVDVRDRCMADPQFPLKLRRLFPDMTSTGIETWNEDRVYVVDVGEGESRRLGFDVETGLLVRLGYKTWLEDYEEVDGVLVPGRVVLGRKGGSTTFITDAVEHNTGIDRTVFSPAK